MKMDVLVIESRALVRDILAQILEDYYEIEHVYKAKNYKHAVSLCNGEKVAVILINLFEEEADDFDVLDSIKKQFPVSKVILLTSCRNQKKILQALNDGADGYVSKDSSSRQIILGIREVLEGNSFCHPPVSALIEEDLEEVRHQLEEANKIKQLTKREHDIVRSIAKGMSNNQIAEILQISDKTVKNHVSNILRKLNLTDRTQIAIFAFDNKLVE